MIESNNSLKFGSIEIRSILGGVIESTKSFSNCH